MLIEIPAELKGLAGPIGQLLSSIETAMSESRGHKAVEYDKVESEFRDCATAIERASHAAMLKSLDVDLDQVAIGGEHFRRVHRSNGTYRTLAGPVVVERATYRKQGDRGGPTVDAISLRTGCYGKGWLPMTAQAMAHALQQNTCREAASTARQTKTLPYSSSTFAEVAHLVGESWISNHADIEDDLAKAEIPEEVCSISTALDRVAVPMEEPRKRPPGRPPKNAPRKPVSRRFRMAYVGTVTLHDAVGKAVRTLRFGCMPQGDPEALCEQMANDVYAMLGNRPDLAVSLLADGSPEMWNLLETAFPEDLFGPVTRRVDFWHLLEKLSPAAKLIFGTEDAPNELDRWKRALRSRNSAALDILEELRRSGLEDKSIDSSKPVHDAITYIENHHERMNYAAALRRKLPIGSGDVEATCKTLVAVRMRRAGSRWKNRTGEHIIRMRALALSDRWDAAMHQLHQTRRTAVRSAA